MLIFIKILKCHVKTLLLPGKSTVAVISPVKNSRFLLGGIVLFFLFLCEGD